VVAKLIIVGTVGSSYTFAFGGKWMQ